MYVILTSKPGLFHVEADLRAMESYDYLFYGKLKAHFTIAELDGETRMRVIEDEPPHIVNMVSTKFLDHFSTIEEAREELRHLTHFGSIETDLVPCAGA